MKIILCPLAGIILVIIFNVPVFGEEWGNWQISYIREVENQLYLSDFQLGSQETIRDEDGHGSSLGWLINNQGTEFFLLNFGISHTQYRGTVEDGVNVSFKPKTGSGFEALSESKNIFYEIDLSFTNPFISLSYTNWLITEAGLRGFRFPLPSTYGIGLIPQKAEGNIIIKGIDGSKIAEATYDSGTQRFYLLGWKFNFEFLYLSLILRNVTSPVLHIENCNSEAVGDLACERIKAATGNRNSSTQLFTGGVFAAGILF